MWLRYHPDGFVLVHRVHPAGCHGSDASGSLPPDGHHGGRTGGSPKHG